MKTHTKMLLAALTAACLAVGTSSHATPLWTPDEITTTMWFDAEDASTLTLGTGGVQTWADKSGNGYDVAQSSADRRPDLLAGGWSNGNDSLNLTQYSATASRKDTLGRNVTADGISGSAYTLFVVVNAQSVDTEEWIHTVTQIGKADTGTHENRFQINTGATGVKVRSDNNGSGPGANGGSGNAAYVAGEQLLQFTLDPTSSEVRRNGTQIASSSGAYVAKALTGNFSINGRNPIDGHAGMTGELGEFIYLTYNPDTATRELIEGYLAWKWGLQGSLAVDHTYKNAAPLIPEPSSLALIGLGGLLIGARRRRG